MVVLAGCDRDGPVDPDRSDVQVTPIERYGPVGPVRPYGTDPSLAAAASDPQCAGRCAIGIGALSGAEPVALNELAQILARDGAGTFVWSRDGGATRVGPLGAGRVGAFITSWGYVVGGGVSASAEQAFLWTSWGGVRPLGALGGERSAGYGSTGDGARIVGGSVSSASPWRAFLWSESGGMRDLGDAFGGGLSEARAINTAGRIAGWAETGAGRRGVVWDETGAHTVLPPLSGYPASEAFAINADGQVAGTASGESRRAWIWSPASGIQSLGTLGGAESEARAINSWGEVVGVSTTAAGSSHAFIWRPEAGMEALESLGRARSEAVSINSWGDILGVLSDADGGNPEVVVWAWSSNAYRYGSVSGPPSDPVDPGDPGEPGDPIVGGVITITFDDGWATTYTRAFAILRDHGLRANVGLITLSVDNWSSFLRLDQLRELAENGWAMVSHSVTHPHLTQVSNAALERELRDSQQWIRDNGFATSNVFLVPYHEWGARELAAVHAHYGAARGHTSTYFWPERYERWPPDDPYALTSVEPEYYAGSFTTPTGREALRRKIERVIAEGEFLDVFFHQIRADEVEAFRLTVELLAEYRDHIRTYHDLFPTD